MSEPITTANATEGGGPPIEPPSIGGASKPFEGLDGKVYTGAPPPPSKPRATRRRTSPEPGEGLTPADGPAEAGKAAQTASAPEAPTAEPPKGLEALRRPGEPDEQFYPRIHQEDRARIQRLQREQEARDQRTETALREAMQEIHRLRAMAEPVFTRQAEEEARRQREELMSQIPDPDAGPEERERYNTMMLQAVLQRQLQAEREAVQRQQLEAQQAAERQQHQQLEAHIADRDEEIQREMAAAVAADPSLAHQIQAHLQLTAHQYRQYDPTASEEEIEQLVYLTHLGEMVDAKARGMSPADYYREQARLLQQTAQAFGMQPAPASPPSQQHAPMVGSPTAAQVAREATRSGTASGGPGRPAGIPGQPNLPTQVFKSEDEYLKAGLRKEFDENWVRDALGKPAEGGRRRR